jgi:hypothetical protein
METMSADAMIAGHSSATEPVLNFHRRVRGMCIERLAQAFNPRTGLFDRQLRDGRWDVTRGTEDVTSTAICLIGLHRAGVSATMLGVSPGYSIAAAANSARRRDYPGAFGLVTWANAACDGMPARRLEAALGVSPLNPAPWLPRITTMEAAWCVGGLAHEALRRPARARDPLAAATRELLGRFDERTRLFRHSTAAAPFVHRLRRWIANFADQVYSVQALAFAAMILGDACPLAAADACASRLIELQGPLGQWPWHYDVRRGEIAGFFPVYAVHQHGMAPMTLMALAAAGGASGSAAIERSVAWILDNELHAPMLDAQAGTIWRDISPREGSMARWAHHARAVLGLRPKVVASHAPLAVNRETRPYEWAWCLYAGAIAEGGRAAGHVV